MDVQVEVQEDGEHIDELTFMTTKGMRWNEQKKKRVSLACDSSSTLCVPSRVVRARWSGVVILLCSLTAESGDATGGQRRLAWLDRLRVGPKG